MSVSVLSSEQHPGPSDGSTMPPDYDSAIDTGIQSAGSTAGLSQAEQQFLEVVTALSMVATAMVSQSGDTEAKQDALSFMANLSAALNQSMPSDSSSMAAPSGRVFEGGSIEGPLHDDGAKSQVNNNLHAEDLPCGGIPEGLAAAGGKEGEDPSLFVGEPNALAAPEGLAEGDNAAEAGSEASDMFDGVGQYLEQALKDYVKAKSEAGA